MTDWIIVGAGFTGATLAERIATERGETVLLVDRRPHIGGNAYDCVDARGVIYHKYGPHIFHTNSKKVWDYLSRFTEWRPYYHHVLALVEGRPVPVPFNLNSIAEMFPPYLAEALSRKLIGTYGFGKKVPILKLRESDDEDLQFLANYVYRHVFEIYTRKQWGLTPEQLDPAVTARVPIYVSRDDRYFQDTYQAMPRHGYTALFERMLAHPNIHVRLETEFRAIQAQHPGARIIFTGPIDEYFDYRFGELPYRSLDFVLRPEERALVQPVGTVNYPNDYDFTRITDMSWLTGQDCGKTLLVEEYPQSFAIGVNERYYPIPNEANGAAFRRYQALAEELDGKVWFAGRLGDYAYYNMDQACARALAIFDKSILK